MSLLTRAFETRAIDASKFNIGLDMSPRTKAGENVTFDTAVGISTAWRCMTLIADTLYSLPVDVFTRGSDGARSEILPKPQLVASPSLLVSARDWRFQGTVSLAAFGNAYGVVLERDRLGRPVTVEWVNPADVSIQQSTSLRKPTYLVGGQPADDMVHLRRYPKPGSVVGMAPLSRHRETLGLAIALRNYAAQWFGDGAHPSSILSTDQVIDETQAKTAKERFLAAIRGKREPAVLGNSWKYESIQSSPQDSETTSLGLQTALAVTQVFGVPPEKVGVASQGSSLTYSNRQDRAIDFLTDTIMPWMTVFEDFWTENLPRPQFAKFNPDALLRADLKTRYESHDIAIRAGWKSVNDVRRLEDEPPIEAGDEYLWPPYATSTQATQETSP